jgi:acetyltransferase
MKHKSRFFNHSCRIARRIVAQTTSAAVLTNGSIVFIRPVQHEDIPLLAKFHETLSERSVYYRWFAYVPLSTRVSPEQLKSICYANERCETVLVAEYHDPETKTHEIVGLACLNKTEGSDEGEFALIISDQLQHHGLGTAMMKRLIEAGCNNYHLGQLTGYLLPENLPMRKLCQKLGFDLRYSMEERLDKAALRFPVHA